MKRIRFVVFVAKGFSHITLQVSYLCNNQRMDETIENKGEKEAGAGAVIPAAAPSIPPAPIKQHWTHFWRENFSSPSEAWRTVNTFSAELSRDYRFWLHMMAVRNGLAVTLLGLGTALAWAATLPLTLAATVIVAAVALTAASAVALGAGARFIWGHVHRAYHAVKHQDSPVKPPLPASAPKPLPQWMQDLAATKPMRAIAASDQWKTTTAFIEQQKKWMLGGTAIGGSALTAGMGIWVLTAQVLVLPVIVVGSAVSILAVGAVAGVISGGFGIYFTCKSMLRWHRESRLTTPAVATPPAPAPSAPATPLPSCKKAFAGAEAALPAEPSAQKAAQTAKKNSPALPPAV